MTSREGARDRLRGVLLGTAAGDALGLAWEGLHGDVVARADPADMLFLGGRGLLSDDTEQSVLVASAWAAGPQRFEAALTQHLRWWLLSMPVGVGPTHRRLFRLLLTSERHSQ